MSDTGLSVYTGAARVSSALLWAAGYVPSKKRIFPSAGQEFLVFSGFGSFCFSGMLSSVSATIVRARPQSESTVGISE